MKNRTLNPSLQNCNPARYSKPYLYAAKVITISETTKHINFFYYGLIKTKTDGS